MRQIPGACDHHELQHENQLRHSKSGLACQNAPNATVSNRARLHNMFPCPRTPLRSWELRGHISQVESCASKGNADWRSCILQAVCKLSTRCRDECCFIASRLPAQDGNSGDGGATAPPWPRLLRGPLCASAAASRRSILRQASRRPTINNRQTDAQKGRHRDKETQTCTQTHAKCAWREAPVHGAKCRFTRALPAPSYTVASKAGAHGCSLCTTLPGTR